MSEILPLEGISKQPEQPRFTHLPLARKTPKAFTKKRFPQREDQKVYGYYGAKLGNGLYLLPLQASKYTFSDLRFKLNPIFSDEKIYSSYVKASRKQVEMQVKSEREINRIRKKWQEKKEQKRLLSLKKERIYDDLQRAFQQEIRKLKNNDS